MVPARRPGQCGLGPGGLDLRRSLRRIFAPGPSWLFGAPGAALWYAVAGALIALPDRAWLGGQLGRRLLAGAGGFLAVMAVLQAWPGRGFWSGTIGRQPGSLTSMVQSMS